MTIFDQVQLDPFRDPDFLSEFGDQFYEFLIENWTKIEPERKSRTKTYIWTKKSTMHDHLTTFGPASHVPNSILF